MPWINSFVVHVMSLFPKYSIVLNLKIKLILGNAKRHVITQFMYGLDVNLSFQKHYIIVINEEFLAENKLYILFLLVILKNISIHISTISLLHKFGITNFKPNEWHIFQDYGFSLRCYKASTENENGNLNIKFWENEFCNRIFWFNSFFNISRMSIRREYHLHPKSLIINIIRTIIKFKSLGVFAYKKIFIKMLVVCVCGNKNLDEVKSSWRKC